MDKITKLSQAIRIGATIHKKCTGQMFRIHPNGETRSCAIGAAYVAAFGTHEHPEGTSFSERVAKRFNISGTVLDQVIKWNDNCRMSREAIADLLEQQGL